MADSSDVLKNHTNFVRANGGLDIYRLQLSDELYRKISSYSSTKPPPNDNVNTWFKNDDDVYSILRKVTFLVETKQPLDLIRILLIIPIHVEPFHWVCGIVDIEHKNDIKNSF
jgi:hypothetical protein